MPKDLLLIILGALVSGAYYSWQDYKRKKKEKQQERLNQISIKDNQFEINADGSETDFERFGKWLNI